MKRFLAFFLVIVFLFAAVGCNNTDENEISGGKKGETTLGNKTPKEAYDAAMDYVKTLENYEVIIQSDFKTTYEGETSEENATTLHKCSGDTFYYLYKSNDYEEFFLHDGTMLYKSINEINEKLDISYGDFMKSWGGVTQDGMLIPLGEASFDKKLFIHDGENYYLEFSISKQEYSDITGGTVEEPVAYKVFFDKDGNPAEKGMWFVDKDGNIISEKIEGVKVIVEKIKVTV